MDKSTWMRIENDPRLKALLEKFKSSNEDIWWAHPEQDQYAIGQWAPGRFASDEIKAEFSDLISKLTNETLEDAIDEADGKKDGKFSVHDMDSNDGDHDDEIDVGFLADSIMHGPGYIPHYDEDGNKIEEE